MTIKKSTVNIFIYVQHLLGIGHLRRASLLAKAMENAGMSVVFASGGRPVSYLDIGDADFLQLPALHASDNSFKILKNIEGSVVDDTWKEQRKELLLSAFREAAPDVLLIEMFPFGRRQMRFELDPLIDLAKSMNIPVISSIRDILTTHKTPGKSEWIIDRVQKDIDHVLVHGDPDFMPLEDSFPLAAKIKDKIVYTGYVVEHDIESPDTRSATKREGVLISGGGGAVALPLAEATIKAKDFSTLKNVPWRLLLGTNLPDQEFNDIVKRAPDGLSVERNRSDFYTLLSKAQLSISQAGYNTVMETLMTETPAIVVPFSADGQSEQTDRAKKLAKAGVLSLLSEANLTPENLAQKIDDVVQKSQTQKSNTQKPGSKIKVDVRGTQKTALFIKDLIEKRHNKRDILCPK
ncbi:glycosyltransferase family protein [Kiloniella sp. EL199]|uniref:glycosyltransferase family protein n=1 Tax=Kiloniella sp. EL199 TaxID=2107581 RepID=UPI000EA2BF21|nr:glycosyltransferase [Kiloniella sp. EL199]